MYMQCVVHWVWSALRDCIEPGNGFINQTNDFIDGYVTGFCSIAGPDASMDERLKQIFTVERVQVLRVI